jgi:hypothetical protein
MLTLISCSLLMQQALQKANEAMQKALGRTAEEIMADAEAKKVGMGLFAFCCRVCVDSMLEAMSPTASNSRATRASTCK